MKNKSISFIMIFLNVLFGYSCKKDFLNTPPSEVAVTEQFIKDLPSCQQVLTGAYYSLAVNFFTGPTLLYPDVVADNLKTTIAGSYLTKPYAWNQIASDGTNSLQSDNMNSAWLQGYNVIRQTNLVLENIDRFVNEDQAKANNIKAQALALRSMVQYYLVNIFAMPYQYTQTAFHAGIPLVKTSDITEPITGRASVSEVYQSIVKDLMQSIQLFGDSQADRTVMSKVAAQGLLARLYLSTGNYTACKNYAMAVIAKVPIMKNDASNTNNYPSNLFTTKETEALFQLQPLVRGVNASANSSFVGPYLTGRSRSFLLTIDLVNILKEYPQDLRKVWYTPSGNDFIATKFPSNQIAGATDPASSYYQTLLRSSEMYLCAAESYAKLGVLDSARYYLNEIRSRAIPGVTPILSSGTDLSNEIEKERRRELCIEGFRMFDLQRLGKGVSRSDSQISSAQTLPALDNHSIAPIPLNDVQINRLPQNQGY